MAINNLIAQAGMTAGQNIQNTVGNGLVRRENQKRYEAEQLAGEKAAMTEQNRYNTEQGRLDQAEGVARKKTQFETNKYNDTQSQNFANQAYQVMQGMEGRTPAEQQQAYAAILQFGKQKGLNGLPAEYSPDVLNQLQMSGGQTPGQFSTKPVGSTQIDGTTGQMFGVEYNPQANTFERKDIDGATGQTPSEKLQLEATQDQKNTDIKNAYDQGLLAFKSVGDTNKNINGLYKARDALKKGGKSGWIEQHLPAFTVATAQLKEVARGMGIDVINSATFGALSERELSLALQQGLPMELDEAELIQHINEKIVAQKKLAQALQDRAKRLMSGKGLSELLDEDIANRMVKPDNLDEADWMLFSSQEQREYIDAGKQ